MVNFLECKYNNKFLMRQVSIPKKWADGRFLGMGGGRGGGVKNVCADVKDDWAEKFGREG